MAWFVLTSAVTASDTRACRQLIEMIDDGQPVDDATAQSLFKSAGTTPQLRSIASQSMALLLIRTHRYSDAWKQLTSDSNSVAAASRSVQLEHEKIKLWLLLEARSANAEVQLKALVTKAIAPDTQKSDCEDASYFLGKLLKLLECGDADCGVSAATAQRAKQVMETQSFKTAVAMFQNGWKETEAWDSDLRRLVAQCPDKSATQTVIKSLDERLESLQRENREGKESQKNEQQNEKNINRERSGLASQMKQLQAEWNLETPGRPQKPSEPKGSEPSKPSSKASPQEQQDYDRKKRDYDRERFTYPQRLEEYQREFARWKVVDKARRDQLNAVHAQLAPQLAQAVANLSAQQDLLKTIAGKLRVQSKQLEELHRELDMARQLLSRHSSATFQPEDLQRPSLYPVLDFSRTAQRLSKMANATP